MTTIKIGNKSRCLTVEVGEGSQFIWMLFTSNGRVLGHAGPLTRNEFRFFRCADCNELAVLIKEDVYFQFPAKFIRD